MDLSDSTRVLLNRITEMDPDIASKAIGYLLLKDYGDKEMIRLAFGPDTAISALVDEVKSALPFINMSPRGPAADAVPNHFRNMQHAQAALSPPAPTPIVQFQTHNGGHHQHHPAFWDTDTAPCFQYTPRSTLVDPHAPYAATAAAPLLTLEDLSACYPAAEFNPADAAVLGPRTTRRATYIFPPLAAAEPPSPKACHYYYKGYCKHGVNCRYLHDPQPGLEGYALSGAGDVAGADDHEFLPGALETLEAEIAELLRSRRGQPISIAMLPMLYHETYGRVLQAEGYLTESQRHGKVGYNLTKLLARMKGTIRLIDRPHGQHSVILAEDAPTGFDSRPERNDSSNLVSSSQQIYLTFPAESTFTEDDIADYFRQFGPVQAVRIPIQQKRMFGFVTFAHAETVHRVFAKGNPHYICDARVLVKPYREKTRKSCERLDMPMCYHTPYLDLIPDFQPVPKLMEPRLLRKQHEQDQLLEVHMRMAQLRFASQPYASHPCVGYNVESIVGYQQEHDQAPVAEEFSRQDDNDVTNETTVEEEERPTNTNGTCADKACQIDLPESPFASL